jgi:hypothetical protein
MGDQVDLPFDQHEEMQQRSLQRRSQPADQLEEVIEEIRELMLRSTQEVVSKEEAEQKRNLQEQQGSNNNNKAEEQVDNSKGEFGIQGDFNNGAEELMSRSS